MHHVLKASNLKNIKYQTVSVYVKEKALHTKQQLYTAFCLPPSRANSSATLKNTGGAR